MTTCVQTMAQQAKLKESSKQ